MDMEQTRQKLAQLVAPIVCWWFGCKPDYKAIEYSYDYHRVPCERCGAEDVCDADQLGDTKHQRLKDWANYWLWRRWWPAKCYDCGKRFGDHSKCDELPF